MDRRRGPWDHCSDAAICDDHEGGEIYWSLLVINSRLYFYHAANLKYPTH